MKNAIVPIALAALLAACAAKSKVDITRGGDAAIQTNSRSEPIFYNGKTYQLDYVFNQGQNLFDMKVSGLGPKNRQDAVNIATSALGYYSCPSGRRGALQGEPTFSGGKWDLKAKCS
jgi:hypothetical protein